MKSSFFLDGVVGQDILIIMGILNLYKNKLLIYGYEPRAYFKED
jgi:hypothetical protein